MRYIPKGKVALAATLILLAAYICGCGYTTTSIVPEGIRSIYVDNFRNDIDFTSESIYGDRLNLYRHRLEADLTRQITERFLFDGGLAVASEAGSDAVLSGSVRSFIEEPLRYDSDDNVIEYRLRLASDVSLTKRGADEPLWSESILAEVTYRTTGVYAKDEDEALDALTEEMARRIVERTIEAW